MELDPRFEKVVASFAPEYDLMPPENLSEVKFEIGHVLFMDIVGYSKLLVDEQAELVKELGDLVNNTEAARKAEARGQLIRLPSGDGMALVFTNSVEAPVKCALEMSAVLNTKPNLPLRMGVHSGPVQQVADVNARTSVAGAGINLAQRVMDCGDAGHILLSKRVADDLAQSVIGNRSCTTSASARSSTACGSIWSISTPSHWATPRSRRSFSRRRLSRWPTNRRGAAVSDGSRRSYSSRSSRPERHFI